MRGYRVDRLHYNEEDARLDRGAPSSRLSGEELTVVVDADRSETSRAFVEQLAASPSLGIVERAADLPVTPAVVRTTPWTPTTG